MAGSSIQFGAEFVLEMPADGPLEVRRNMRELKKIIQETVPEQEQFARAENDIDNMTKLLNLQLEKGVISQDHYTAALQRMIDLSPQSIKAQRTMAEAAEKAAEAQKQLDLKAAADEQARLNEELKKAAELQRHVERALAASIPEQEQFAQSERLTADIVKSLNAQLTAGTITQEHYAAAVKHLADTSPQAVKAQQQMAEAAKKTADVERRLEAVLNETIPEQQRFAQAERETAAMTKLLNQQLEKGTITQDHYTAALKRMADTSPQALKAQQAAQQSAKSYQEYLAKNAAARASDAQRAQGAMLADIRSATGQLPIIGQFVNMMGPATAAVIAGGLALKTVSIQFELIGAAASYSAGEISKAFQAIDATSDAAEKLGISATSLQILQTQAALSEVSTESLTSGIQKMEIALADAAEQGGATAEKFKRLGLDAGELLRLQPDKQFGKIADAIAKLPTRAQQLNAVFDIFGRGNVDLVKMVQRFRELEKAAIESGNVLSEMQFDENGKTDEKLRMLQLSLQGLWKQVAVEITPAFGHLAEVAAKWIGDKNNRDEIVSMFARIGRLVDNIASGFETISGLTNDIAGKTQALAYVASILGGPAIVTAPIGVTAGLLKPGQADIADTQAKRMAAEYDIAAGKIGGAERELSRFNATAVALATMPTLGGGMFSMFDGLGDKLKKIGDDQQKFIEGLRWQLEITGKTTEEVEMMRAERLHMSQEQIEEIRALLNEKKTLEEIFELEKQRNKEQQDAMTEAERLRDSLMSGEERVQRQMARWQDLVDRGALTQAEFEQLSQRERAKLQGAAVTPNTIRAGSVEAIREKAMQMQDRRKNDDMLRVLGIIASNTDPDKQEAVEIMAGDIQ